MTINLNCVLAEILNYHRHRHHRHQNALNVVFVIVVQLHPNHLNLKLVLIRRNVKTAKRQLMMMDYIDH